MALLEMTDIDKSFNGVQVLKKARLTVEKGEVHALLGENGAGKSTMMNILTGSVQKDAGTIVFDGKPLKGQTIRQTEEFGIAFVHQELNLFNDLRAFENIFLGKEETGRFGKLKKKDMIQKTRELFQRLQVDIDPEAMVSDLKTSDKQLLEISKALFFQCRLLILDEPTTALTMDEVEHLFSIVNGLKKKGISFIFISHKMPEIFAYADRYTVMRNGQYIGEGKIKDTTPDAVTQMMVGTNTNAKGLYTPRRLGEPVLTLEHLTGKGFQDVTLSVRKGEVLGFTGLQGSGSSELLQTLFGILPAAGGEVRVHGKPLKTGSVHRAMEAGLALLPSNRKENSVLPDMSILENMFLSEQTLSAKNFPIHWKKEEEKYEHYHRILNIKAASSSMPVVSLSGGNQQKVFIARWLNTNAKILLFDNPTQGIDVGAKQEIYALILQLASEGKTIIVNTLEIPELIKVADRCVIFYGGRIAKVLEHDKIEEHKVMMYATGTEPLAEERVL